VHEFWQETLGGDLPDLPLSVPEIIELIKRTGWAFTWKSYQPSNGKSAHDNLLPDLIGGPDIDGFFRAVAYARKDRVGHCAVISGAIEQLESDYRFACFQQETYGLDVSEEVKAANVLFTFCLRCPRDTSQWHAWVNRRILRTLERRRDPVWKEKRVGAINRALTQLGMEQLESWFPGEDGQEKRGKKRCETPAQGPGMEGSSQDSPLHLLFSQTFDDSNLHWDYLAMRIVSQANSQIVTVPAQLFFSPNSRATDCLVGKKGKLVLGLMLVEALVTSISAVLTILLLHRYRSSYLSIDVTLS